MGKGIEQLKDLIDKGTALVSASAKTLKDVKSAIDKVNGGMSNCTKILGEVDELIKRASKLKQTFTSYINVYLSSAAAISSIQKGTIDEGITKVQIAIDSAKTKETAKAIEQFKRTIEPLRSETDLLNVKSKLSERLLELIKSTSAETVMQTLFTEVKEIKNDYNTLRSELDGIYTNGKKVYDSLVLHC